LRKFLFILSLIICYPIFSQYYTGSNIPFGQNRVQYNSFYWQSYEFQRSKVYFTKGGEDHAKFASKVAYEFQLELEKFLDFSVEEKIHLIVFNSQSKFRQSNIGLNNDITSNIGGTSNIDGEKIFLYFNGNHNDFINQIKRGIAEILVTKILYGTDWKQTVKNTTFINLPPWFKDGLIDYLSIDWNTRVDSQLKDLILSKKLKHFQSLSTDESVLYGHGLWRYIDEVFGRNMIPNLMYMMKVSKSVESGFIYVLGITSEMIQKDFTDHYKIQYLNDQKNTLSPNEKKIALKSKKDRFIRNLKVSPDGAKIAFVEHYLGQYKVKIFDIKEKKIEVIVKGDHKLNRIPDISHPVIDWHPKGNFLAIFEEKKGGVWLNLYDTKLKKKNYKEVMGFEKILSSSYNSKGNRMILSAVKDSYTDLFEYTVLGNSHKQLTDDIYDDLEPKYFPNSDEIIFSSNRHNKALISNNLDKDFDLFELNTSNKKITSLTNSNNIDERQPQPLEKKNYHYVSDENGIFNHYQTIIDSTISHIDTIIHYRYTSSSQQLSNFNRNIIEIDFSRNLNQYVLLYRLNNEYEFYLGDKNKSVIFENTFSETFFKNISSKKTDFKTPNQNDIEIDKIDIYNYKFEDEKKLLSKKIVSKKENERKSDVKFPRQKIYNVNFTVGEFILQLNPTFNNQAYQRYSSSGFKNAGFDGFTMIQAKDVFEDYKISGGFKGPVQLNNIGLIAIYENLKNRLDSKFQISRQSFEDLYSDNIIIKTIVNDFKHQFSFPFSEVSSLRFTSNLRYDKVVTLSNSTTTLAVPNENFMLLGGLLEYVYDATRPIALNINNGFKFKTWVEGYNEFFKPQTDFFVFGLDLRNYQKIHRNIVFASRLAASTSIGSQKLLYYLGGVDGYLWAQFDPTILPDPDINFQFQTIATPIRGFYQNARNGNSFVAISNELRVPLFSYFSKKPLSSDFLENFMLIGFGDIGSAWTGKTPYSTENSFNSSVINGHNYTINLKSQKEPIIYSYGFGIRSRIFGYYIRLDWGYGIDDQILMPSIKQLSLSLDF
jgi:Tol biopolymer transport system component